MIRLALIAGLVSLALSSTPANAEEAIRREVEAFAADRAQIEAFMSGMIERKLALELDRALDLRGFTKEEKKEVFGSAEYGRFVTRVTSHEKVRRSIASYIDRALSYDAARQQDERRRQEEVSRRAISTEIALRQAIWENIATEDNAVRRTGSAACRV